MSRRTKTRRVRRSRASIAASTIGTSSSTWVWKLSSREVSRVSESDLPAWLCLSKPLRCSTSAGPLAQQRDAGERLGVGGAREQAEEAALADHLAVGSNFFTLM